MINQAVIKSLMNRKMMLSSRPLTYSMIRSILVRGIGSYPRRPVVSVSDSSVSDSRPESETRFDGDSRRRPTTIGHEGRGRRGQSHRTPMGRSDPDRELKFGDERRRVVESYRFSRQLVNEFGTLGPPEVLASESVADDDDGYDRLEIGGRKPAAYYEEEMKRLIHGHVGPDKMKRAVHLFQEMTQVARHEPAKSHYSLLITGCSHLGLFKHAFDLFEKMPTHLRRGGNKVTPTPGMVTSLFNACAQAEEGERRMALEKANQFRDWLYTESFPLTTIHYNVMVKTFAKLGDMRQAFQILHEMRQEEHPVTEITFAMLLMGSISDTASGFSHAIHILRHMDKLSIPFNLHILNLLLRSARDCGIGSKEHLEHLTQEWVLDVKRLSTGSDGKETTDAKESKVSKESLCTETISGTKDSHAEIGAENGSFGTSGFRSFDSCDTSSSASGSRSFGDGLDCGSTSHGSMYQSDSMAVKPSILRHSSDLIPVVENLVTLDLEALKLPKNRLALIGGPEWVFDMIRKYKMKPTIATMTTLLSCLPDTVQDEEELIRRCDSLRIKYDVDFFNVLIKRRSIRAVNDRLNESRFLEIDSVIRELQSRGLQVNVMTFGVLALSCYTRKRGLKLIQDMRSAGVRINLEVMGSLVKSACVSSNVKYLRDLLQVIEEERINPDPKLLETTEKFVEKVDRILFEQENGLAQVTGIFHQSDYVYHYNDFKLFYKGWLKRLTLERPSRFSQQFEFTIPDQPRTKMFQFEQEMRRRLKMKYETHSNSSIDSD